MNYQLQIYKNAFHSLENIFMESQYNPDVDLYRSFDIMNSINSAQMAGKEWLVDELIKILSNERNLRDGPIRDILVMGGWYGITGMLLRDKIDHDVKIWNIDSDPYCEIYGKMLHENIPELEYNWFHTEDALEYYFDRTDAFQLIINTSCEHMEQEDIDMILSIKPPNTIVCFQSNNYHSVQSHINTHDTLEDFEKSLNLTRVWYSGKLPHFNGDYDRYMVIGI